MSNYNTTLQSNNTDLQAILNTINELPEAVEQATPVISVNTSGLITATAGAKSSTHQLAFQPAKTITPTTANQIAVSSGCYTGGNITVAAVPTQSKTVTPTSTTQNITPDSGKFLSKVTVNGDANLVAGNIKSGVSIFGVNGTYVGSGGSSGDASIENNLINGTLKNYTNNTVTAIRDYAFASCTSLTSVSFPACTTIGDYAFSRCHSLASVSFPACTSIETSAFYNCTNLTSVSFPACTTIGTNAFAKCYGLTYVNFSKCTSIGASAFSQCDSLTSVNFPACTSIGKYAFHQCGNLISVSFPACTSIEYLAFYGCTDLTSVNFPACTSIEYLAFHHCTNLTSVSFPACTTIGTSAFVSCTSLTSVSFPACTSIETSAFYGCTSLTTIYLNASSLCQLSGSNVFSNTGIWSYKGSIFVPSSLVASYKTATNWAFFAKRIYSMS